MEYIYVVLEWTKTLDIDSKKYRLLNKDLQLNWFSKPLFFLPPCLKSKNKQTNKHLLLMKIWLMFCLGHVPHYLGIDRTWQVPPTHVLWEPQNRRSFACLTFRAWCSRCPLSMPGGSDPTQNIHKQMLLCYKTWLQEAVVGVVLSVKQS